MKKKQKPKGKIPLIAGNWKMNFDHLQAIANVQKLAWSLKDANHNFDEVEVSVIVPFTDLRSVQTLISADKLDLMLGAQDLSQHDEGAYTGDISGKFLAKLDVTYVLVGHSERRNGHGETDEIVVAKAQAAVRHGLVPIICVGETAEDLAAHGPAKVAVEQLKAALGGIKADQNFVIAYEPVWAIGTGQAATPEEAADVCQTLRETVATHFDENTAAEVRVLYGGSVTSGNVAQLLRQKHIDGVLVGGASLKPDEFSKIAQFKKHVVA